MRFGRCGPGVRGGSQRASVGFTCHKRHVSLKELANGDGEMAVAPEKIDIKLNINGHDYAARVEPRKTLVDVIRDECGLTGTHIGTASAARAP